MARHEALSKRSKPIHRLGFSPMVPEIQHARYGDLESVRTLLSTTCPPSELAAIFVEPIQGEGGILCPPADFLPGLRRICDEHGILLVFDEIQTGIGRTGRMFAAEHWGVAPDIICLAKGIANGLPLGAIVARADVMDWTPGSHASTFGGNPVACAAALATLKLVELKYRANAHRRGLELRKGLHELADAFSCIRDVRGLGLMVGLEIGGRDGADPDRRDKIIQECFELAGCCCCLAAPAPSGSAHRCASRRGRSKSAWKSSAPPFRRRLSKRRFIHDDRHCPASRPDLRLETLSRDRGFRFQERILLGLEGNTFAQRLRQRMKDETSTRFADWVDHLVLSRPLRSWNRI